MNLYLVRHGQTSYSRDNRFCGSLDPALTASGEAMAQAFAQAYAPVAWAGIYTSPMLRARQTADPLTRLTHIPATVDEGLSEIAYGEWEGLRQDEVKAQWPDAFAYWAENVASRGTPGGETAFHVAARAMRSVEAIRTRHQDGNVLLVSHKATLRIITCALLGLDVRLFRDRIAQPVAAVTMFVLQNGAAQLAMLGDRSHLSAELRNQEGT
ncbi:MAG: histidine phosphatase family protein [Acidobacteriota bacterium]|nr:histidine phosphatase family protein [Acidobacteriota bacterium]